MAPRKLPAKWVSFLVHEKTKAQLVEGKGHLGAGDQGGKVPLLNANSLSGKTWWSGVEETHLQSL